MCGSCGCQAGRRADVQASDRSIALESDLFAENRFYAAANRDWFQQHGILALNLLSSPGSGKTTLLTRSLHDLQADFRLAVIEGDQQTDCDAERIRATGAPVLQINTGKGCHLDGAMVSRAVTELCPHDDSVLFIENVGNLVCPALFDLGEAGKIVILSVTEGDDKPLKYPDMFHAADLVLLNKIDLLPYVPFQVDRCREYLRRINPEAELLQLSAHDGTGMDDWYRWLASAFRKRRQAA